MQTAHGDHDTSLIEQLFQAPHRFQFAQAVRILLRWLGQHGVAHDEALRRILRFQNSLSLAFPASEIAAIGIDGKTVDIDKPVTWNPSTDQITLTPAFIGLLGTCGPMPLHYTEQCAAAASMEGDASFRAFIDVFSHGMVKHYFHAWGKYRFEQPARGRGTDDLAMIVQALSGSATRRDDGIPAYYAAALRTRPIGAVTIGRLLSEYFDTPIGVEELIGTWDPLPPGQRSTFGVTRPRLGHTAVLGTRVWRHDRRIRLDIGPVDRAGLFRYAPGGDAALGLERMLGLLALPGIEYEARVMLSPPAIEALTLQTREPSDMRRLGWNSFLTTRPGQVQRPELRHMLRPRAH